MFHADEMIHTEMHVFCRHDDKTYDENTEKSMNKTLSNVKTSYFFCLYRNHQLGEWGVSDSSKP